MSHSVTPARGALRSRDASIGATLRHDAVLADGELTAETRFDPQSGPAAAAWAERATSWLGRATASQGLPSPASAPRRREWTVA